MPENAVHNVKDLVIMFDVPMGIVQSTDRTVIVRF